MSKDDNITPINESLKKITEDTDITDKLTILRNTYGQAIKFNDGRELVRSKLMQALLKVNINDARELDTLQKFYDEAAKPETQGPIKTVAKKTFSFITKTPDSTPKTSAFKEFFDETLKNHLINHNPLIIATIADKLGSNITNEINNLNITNSLEDNIKSLENIETLSNGNNLSQLKIKLEETIRTDVEKLDLNKDNDLKRAANLSSIPQAISGEIIQKLNDYKGLAENYPDHIKNLKLHKDEDLEKFKDIKSLVDKLKLTTINNLTLSKIAKAVDNKLNEPLEVNNTKDNAQLLYNISSIEGVKESKDFKDALSKEIQGAISTSRNNISYRNNIANELYYLNELCERLDKKFFTNANISKKVAEDFIKNLDLSQLENVEMFKKLYEFENTKFSNLLQSHFTTQKNQHLNLQETTNEKQINKFVASFTNFKKVPALFSEEMQKANIEQAIDNTKTIEVFSNDKFIKLAIDLSKDKFTQKFTNLLNDLKIESKTAQQDKDNIANALVTLYNNNINKDVLKQKTSEIINSMPDDDIKTIEFLNNFSALKNIDTESFDIKIQNLLNKLDINTHYTTLTEFDIIDKNTLDQKKQENNQQQLQQPEPNKVETTPQNTPSEKETEPVKRNSSTTTTIKSITEEIRSAIIATPKSNQPLSNKQKEDYVKTYLPKFKQLDGFKDKTEKYQLRLAKRVINNLEQDMVTNNNLSSVKNKNAKNKFVSYLKDRLAGFNKDSTEVKAILDQVSKIKEELNTSLNNPQPSTSTNSISTKQHHSR